MVGELATQQAIVWHGRQQGLLDSDSCHNAIHLVQKIAKDLQSLSLSLRLQPLQGLFQRLERTIRDLARSQGKKVEVVLKGEDVELDKSVAERIADALTHVVRNALDHGVETSEERETMGKTPIATIVLEAQPSASGVLIKIGDDGRGLNAEKIRKKAIERGLLSTQDELPEADIHRLIFHAGLSTAETITDVSGRGVGMDVVKTSVENIGGSIQLSSKIGQGTSFSISLPATLTILDALLVRSGANLYALPLQDVAEIIDLGELEVERFPGGSRMLRLRNSFIPVEDLAAHLPPEREAVTAIEERQDSMQPAVLIRIGDHSLAFALNRIVGQQLVTVRGLPTALASIPGYTGGTILGDGSPCVVLNLSALASRHFDQIHRGASSTAPSILIAPTRFEESDLRCLVIQTGESVFATSLMMVREILEDLPHELMPDSEGGFRRFIAVRGELIPVFALGLYEEESSDRSTYLVTADGHRAIGVSRVLAVSSLESVESHRANAESEEVSGIVGFRRFQDHYIPMLDLHLALENRSAAAQLSKGQRAS